MVYLLGTTSREYTIDGITIPKKQYNERELELGKRTVLEIDEVVYAKLSANKIFQMLTQQGDIQVKDKAPVGQETPAELRQKLLTQEDAASHRIAELLDEIAQLKEAKGSGGGDNKALAEAEKKYRALEEEALKDISALTDRVKFLERVLDENGIAIPEDE